MWCPVPLSRNKDMETRQTGRCLREYKAQLGRVPEWFEYHASYAAAKGFEGRLPSLTEADHTNMVWRVPGFCSLLLSSASLFFFYVFPSKTWAKSEQKNAKNTWHSDRAMLASGFLHFFPSLTQTQILLSQMSGAFGCLWFDYSMESSSSHRC